MGVLSALEKKWLLLYSSDSGDGHAVQTVSATPDLSVDYNGLALMGITCLFPPLGWINLCHHSRTLTLLFKAAFGWWRDV